MRELKIRTAFILGAGLGIRLRPLTEACPKPLLAVGGRPLITYAMDHCLAAGVQRFIVNTHHCPAAYDRAFPERSWRGWPILFRHEPVLLDTAGGLKNSEDLLGEDETILVYNGDVISDLPLGPLLKAHAAGGRDVTLVLRSDGPGANVSLDAAGSICDMRYLLGHPGVRCCRFTGIYAIEKRFLGRLTPGKVESVVPVFVEMIRENPGSVGSVVIEAGIWEDIGSPAVYERIRAMPPTLGYAEEGGGPQKTGSGGLRRRSGRTRRPTSSAGGGRSTPESAVPAAGGGSEVGGDARTGGRDAQADAFVRRTLGLTVGQDLTLVPVGRGGSDRAYFRAAVRGGRESTILMRYDRLREENNYYAEIAIFLKEIGVSVPACIAHEPERGLLLMEDLGDEDLFSLRDGPWDLRRGLYEKTLACAARLHAVSPDVFPAERVRLMPGFSAELYQWEQEHFREKCVVNVCGIALDHQEEDGLEVELAALAGRLLELPRVLVHRDLQSQNVMIRDGEPVLIDFQGMRFGSLFYDLASLLYDPYVEIREADRSALLGYYYDLARPGRSRAEFAESFLIASAQRLMQALGAYGFLGLERGKPHFLTHIGPALDRLIAVSSRAGTLPWLHALARRCRASVGIERSASTRS